MENGNLIIVGNYVDLNGEIKKGRIRIDDGIIIYVHELADFSSVDTRVDTYFGEENIIFPGFIDTHVHFREYSLPEDASDEQRKTHEAHLAKETFETGSLAAINGGVTVVGIMPNLPIPPIDELTYAKQLRLAKEKMQIDFINYCLVEQDSIPFGDLPYKLYTHDVTKQDMNRLFERYARITPDSVLTLHCENQTIIDLYDTRPAHAEVTDAIYCMQQSLITGLPIHITHLSSGDTLTWIEHYKEHGAKVTCDTTITYVYDQFRDNSFIRMKPPRRQQQDREDLIEAIIDGTIDRLTTDHAPHTISDKEKGMFGIPLIDNYTNTVGWLMQQGVPLNRIVEMCCSNPGEFIGKYTGEKHGQIDPGFVGSFTVVQKNEPRVLSKKDVKTKCGWTPFEGSKLGDEYTLDAYETIVKGVPQKNV